MKKKSYKQQYIEFLEFLIEQCAILRKVPTNVNVRWLEKTCYEHLDKLQDKSAALKDALALCQRITDAECAILEDQNFELFVEALNLADEFVEKYDRKDNE